MYIYIYKSCCKIRNTIASPACVINIFNFIMLKMFSVGDKFCMHAGQIQCQHSVFYQYSPADKSNVFLERCKDWLSCTIHYKTSWNPQFLYIPHNSPQCFTKKDNSSTVKFLILIIILLFWHQMQNVNVFSETCSLTPNFLSFKFF